MAYNGWSNYATWNVNLWIDNEYGIYMEKVDMLKRRKRPVTSQTVRNFYRDFMGGSTPDIEEMRRSREPYGRVNYREIADHWETERQDLLGD